MDTFLILKWRLIMRLSVQTFCLFMFKSKMGYGYFTVLCKLMSSACVIDVAVYLNHSFEPIFISIFFLRSSCFQADVTMVTTYHFRKISNSTSKMLLVVYNVVVAVDKFHFSLYQDFSVGPNLLMKHKRYYCFR